MSNLSVSKGRLLSSAALPVLFAIMSIIFACSIIASPRLAQADEIEIDGISYSYKEYSSSGTKVAITGIKGVGNTAIVQVPENINGLPVEQIGETFKSVKLEKVKALDVSECKSLKYLDCEKTGLEKLTLGDLPMLSSVYCAENSLGSYFHPELHFRENRSSPAKSLLEFSAWREVRQKVRQISTVFKTGHLQEKNRRAPTNADALR